MAGHGIVTQLNPASATTEDFTKTGLGTVIGYFFCHSHITTINTNTDGIAHSFGMTDLSSQSHTAIYGADNVATGDTGFDNTDGAIARSMATDAATSIEVAVHDSLTTDGVTVDWTTATATQRASTAIMFSEGIADFWSDDTNLNQTLTCGFLADLVIVVSNGNLGTESSGTDGRRALCYYDRRNDTMSQWLIFTDAGVTIPDAACRSENVNELHGNINNVGNAYNDFAIENFTSTGFDITLVANSNISGHVTAIKFSPGYDFEIGWFAAPTSTGDQTVISGLRFTPQLALFSGTFATSLNSATNDMIFHDGGTDGDNDFSCGAYYWQTTSTANTDCGGWHRNDSAIYCTDENGTLEIQADSTLTSGEVFDNNSVTLNFGTADVARQIMYLVIGQRDPQVTVRSTAGNVDANDVSPEVDSPSSITAGDLLVIIWLISDSGTQSITPPSGWTEEDTDANGTVSRRYVIFTKRADATDAANAGTSDYYVFSGMNGSDDVVYAIFSLYDPQGGTVEYVADSFTTSIETDHDTTTDAPSQTLTVDGSLVIACYENNGANAWQINSSTSFSEGYYPTIQSDDYTAVGLSGLTMVTTTSEWDTADSPTGVITLGHADLDDATALGQFAFSALFQVSQGNPELNPVIKIHTGPIR